MHSDIVVLQALWEIDSEMDDIRTKLESLAEHVRKSVAAVEAIQGELDTHGQRLDENQESLLGVRRKCAKYVRKRDDTRKLIDEGRAPDYFVAQKQFEQCSEIVDELEFEELELMETRDEMELHRRNLEQKKAECLGAAREAAAEQQSQRPPKVERYRSLQPTRKQRREQVPRFLHAIYDGLRDRERLPLVHMVDDICPQCNISAPPQMILEIKS